MTATTETGITKIVGTAEYCARIPRDRLREINRSKKSRKNMRDPEVGFHVFYTEVQPKLVSGLIILLRSKATKTSANEHFCGYLLTII